MTNETSINPFDPAALRLSQDFVTFANVKKELTTVRAKRPGKQTWFRTHSSPEYRVQLAVIDLKDDDEVYAVVPALVEALKNEVLFVTIYTVIDRHGVVTLWPVRLPPADGSRDNTWHISAREAAESATTQWTRITANRQLGAYEVFHAPDGLPEPEWPADKTLADLLQVAFGQGYLVDSLEHPVVKKLRGMA